jgi:hypothetical protein
MTSGLLVSGSGIQFCFGQTLINFAILERTQLSSLQLHSTHVRFVGPASGRGTSKKSSDFSLYKRKFDRNTEAFAAVSDLFVAVPDDDLRIQVTPLSLSLTHTHTLSLSLALSL